MIKKLAILAISISSVFAMHNAELNINEYDLEAGLKLDMGQFNTAVEPDTTFVGFNYLKASPENDDIDGTGYDLDEYFDFNFMVKQKIQSTDFKVGLGVKSVFIMGGVIDDNIDSYMAVPICGELMYTLPINTAIPLGFKIAGSYAPESLSFSDADSYSEFRFEAFARLMDQASIYAGYRNIDIEIDNSNYTYNEAVYFGIKFSF